MSSDLSIIRNITTPLLDDIRICGHLKRAAMGQIAVRYGAAPVSGVWLVATVNGLTLHFYPIKVFNPDRLRAFKNQWLVSSRPAHCRLIARFNQMVKFCTIAVVVRASQFSASLLEP